MDTIILRDLAVHLQPPRDQDDDVTEVRFIIQLAFSRRVFDTAGTGGKEPNELAWKAVGSFLVPTCSKTFTLSIVEYRPNQTSYVTAYSEVDTSVLYVKANRSGQTKCTIPVFMVEDTVKETPFAEVSFNTQLVSSNNNGRVTPLEVCDLVKTLDMIGIISLLESISGDDDACVNACIGMLNALYGVVHYLPDDPKDRPYALAMLSYIHVVRYDNFLESHPELGTTTAARQVITDHSEFCVSSPPPSAPYNTGAGTGSKPPSESPDFPQFIIFGHELARAISMLEDACNIVSETHEKRGWLYLTLCRAIRSAMLQSETDPASFAGWTNKLARHVREVGGAEGRDVGVFGVSADEAAKIKSGEAANGKKKDDAKAKQDAADALLGDYLPGQLEWEKGLVEYAETALLKEKAGLMGYAGHALLRVYGFTKKRQFLDEAVEMLEEAVRLELEWEKDQEKTEKWMNMDLSQPPEANAASEPTASATSPKSSGKAKGKAKASAQNKAPPAPAPNNAAASSTSTFIAMGMGIVFPKGIPKSLTEPKKPKPKETPTARKGGLYSDLGSALIARYNDFEPHEPRDMTRAMEVQLVTVQLLLDDSDKTKAERLNALGFQSFEHAGKSMVSKIPGLEIRLLNNAVASYEEALRIVGGNTKEKCDILHNLAAALQVRYSSEMQAAAKVRMAQGGDDPVEPLSNPKELARIQTAMAKCLRIVQPNDPKRLTYIINYSRYFLFKFAAQAGAAEVAKHGSPPRLAEIEVDSESEYMECIRQAADLYTEAVALALVQRRGGNGKRKEAAADAPGPPRDRFSPQIAIENLHSLGMSLLSCKKQILLLDPEGAPHPTAHRLIAMSKDVLRMFDDSDPDIVSYIMDVTEHITNFADESSLAELKDALAMSERARRMAKEGTEDMLEVLQGMGAAHHQAAKINLGCGRLSVCDDHLAAAVSLLTKALELIKTHPEHHSVHQVYWALGHVYLMRYNRNLQKNDPGEGDSRKKYTTDLTESSNMYREFVFVAGRVMPEGATWANELATAYLDRYDEYKEFKDLETAMTRLEWCIFYPRLLPPSVTGGVQPNEPAPTVTDLLGRQDSIRSLFCGRFARFYFRGELQDFKNGMLTMSLLQTLRKAGPTADGIGWSENDEDGETLFEYLAEYFTIYFETAADVDLVVAEFSKQATLWSKDVSAQPPNKFEVAGLMDPLVYLSVRLGRLHGKSKVNPQLLDQLESAVKVISETHPKKATTLQFVGDIQTQHFVFTNKLKHISSAILLLREALRLSKGLPTYPERATFLGQALLYRFRFLGDLSDIDEAVAVLKQALVVAQVLERVKYDLLNRYGMALHERYGRFGDVEDMTKALQIFQISKQTPMRSGEKVPDFVESSLQAVLSEPGDSIEDLADTTSFFKKESDWKKSQDLARLEGYGNVLLRRFRILAESGDVDKSILVFERALDRAKGDKETRVRLLRALGFALGQRYSSNNDTRDISRCITYLQEALNLAPGAHPSKGNTLFDLGRWLPMLYEKTGDSRDLEKAFSYLRSAASQYFSNTVWRFRAASLWAYWIKHFNRGDPLSAYRLSMELLPQLTWLGIATPVRQTQLYEVVTVAADAVAVAIQDRQEVTAVEWFELGRSVIWGQLNQLQAPVKDLSSVHPSYAERLQLVTDKMLSLSQSRSEDVKPAKKAGGAERYHDLAQEHDRVLKEIRSLDGFNTYMQPTKLHDIVRDCRLPGHVIMINVSTSRCDALVVTPADGSTLHVPLPDFTYADAEDVSQSLQSILGRTASSRRPQEHPQSRRQKKRITNDVVLEHMLSKLWLRVVKPILDGIGIKEPRKDDLPRVWWCLSGPLAFIPIHAAGLYSNRHRAPGHKLCDFAVSSYAPSLSALFNAARNQPSTKPKVLAVAFPEEPKLASTQREVDTLVARGPLSTVKLLGREATVDAVVSRLKDCSFVHFACHGVQKLDNPLDSSLLLADRSPLSLAKLSMLALPQAEFAYLSACQTAASDPLVPEESVHLGAGVFVAGYRSVIAEMWSTPDEDGPVVADAVYAHLFAKGRDSPDATDAAYALHIAVQQLRDRAEKVPFMSWLPYVHIGV